MNNLVSGLNSPMTALKLFGLRVLNIHIIQSLVQPTYILLHEGKKNQQRYLNWDISKREK